MLSFHGFSGCLRVYVLNHNNPDVYCKSAIIAQIAITMLSLSNFDSVHWAATALAYSSLICGITSTFYAFIVQELLSDLHSPEDVRAWLTTTRHSRSWPSRVFFGPERATNAQDRIPSIASAMTLTMPSKLLRMAVFALFVALGIYLGSVYQSGLGNLEGRGANMWVLIFFIVVLSLALVSSFVPMAASDSGDEAMSTDEELQNSRDGAPTRRQEPGNVIRDALESSIRAQEESLKAQKVLLDLLNARPPGLESTLATIASN